MRKLLYSVFHAGLSLTLYLLPVERVESRRDDLLDVAISVVTCIAIVAFWLLRPSRNITAATPSIVNEIEDSVPVSLRIMLTLFLIELPFLLIPIVLIQTLGNVGLMMLSVLFAGGISSGLIYLLMRQTSWIRFSLAIVILPIIFTLPISEVIVRSQFGVRVWSFLHQHDPQHWFPIEITIEMSVSGEPLVIQRVVSCTRLISSFDLERLDSVAQTHDNWFPGIKSFGQRFADGSGVFVITPDICRDLAPRELVGSGTAVSAQGYVPLVRWTPTAD